MKQLTYSETIKNLRGLLKDYIIKSNVKSLVLGISGGIDSALVAALVKPVIDELGIPLIGRSISIQTNKEDEEERARLVGNAFCTDFSEVNLTKQYLVLREFDDMEGESDNDIYYKIRMGNIKARMRMTYLYNLASKTSGLVLGTENQTEYNLAFFTLHGDAGSDLEPIEGLWKTEVYDMTEWLASKSNDKEKEILMSCVNCDATDGLGISNTDLDQILPDWKNRHTTTRSGYSEVDEIFISYFDLINRIMTEKSPREKSNLMLLIDMIKTSPVIERHIRTDFKRNHPYTIKREDIV
jgi:NAD+ synthetase